MFVVRCDGELWQARRVTLKHSSGDFIRRFKAPEMLVKFLRSRPRTNYRLEGVHDEMPLPRTYNVGADDILLGEIWFDPDQNKVVTN